jgi:hypothetical protein
MIEFHCKSCGWKLRVPQAYAGKKGRCPKCKTVLRVPKSATRGTGPDAGVVGQPEVSSETSPYDLTLLEVPHEVKDKSETTGQPDSAEATYEQLRRLQGGLITSQDESIPQRRFPWIIDIFFYPLSKAGLSIILISVGIPFVLRLLTKLLQAFTLVFLPVLVFWILFIIAHWSLLLIFVLYVCWYAFECMRDSAAGGLRAPETAGIAPGLGDILRQTLRLVVCLLFYMSPALLYLAHTQRPDPILWLLYGCGGFLVPMGLLAVFMFDSLRAINPILVIGSIRSTFFQYCGLVVFCYALCLSIPLAAYFLLRVWTLGYVFLLIFFYLTLILAHLLGRFFWKYEDKLNWEV